jgi:hypothetical protein
MNGGWEGKAQFCGFRGERESDGAVAGGNHDVPYAGRHQFGQPLAAS